MNKDNKPVIHNLGRSSDFIIRIKSGNEAAIKGKIEHVYSGEVQYFNDFLEMILLMQNKLDLIGSPQSDTELRFFKG